MWICINANAVVQHGTCDAPLAFQQDHIPSLAGMSFRGRTSRTYVLPENRSVARDHVFWRFRLSLLQAAPFARAYPLFLSPGLGHP